MRNRQVKKFAKNAKRDMAPYRQARKGGSKKLCRRMKAFNRVHRAHDREQAENLVYCRGLLEQIDTFEPRNEKERERHHKLGPEIRAKVVVSIARHETRIRQKKEIEAAHRGLESLMKMMDEAIDENGRWRRTKVG